MNWLKIKDIIKENLELKEKLKIAEEKLGNPIYVVEKIFKKGITWYDWNELSADKRRAYYAEAQKFVKSEVINNIRNYLVAQGTQSAFLEQTQEFNKIRDFQMTINGMDLLFRELEGIQNPDAPIEQTDNIYNGL